jgi:hypothetical protein
VGVEVDVGPGQAEADALKLGVPGGDIGQEEGLPRASEREAVMMVVGRS